MRPALLVLLLVAVAWACLGGAARPLQAAEDWAEARKAFLAKAKNPDWKVRSTAFGDLAYFDDEKAVAAVLGVLASESQPNVLLAGIRALGTFRSAAARAAVADTVRKGKDPLRLYALFAVADQPGSEGKEVLLELLQAREAPVLAQAALALGRKQVRDALPSLLALLRHKDVRVRGAAARAVRYMGGSPGGAAGAAPGAPAAGRSLATPEVLGALVDALEAGEGRERADLLATLQHLTRQDLGWDIAAWRALAQGGPVDTLPRNPRHPAYFFGLPVFGRRLVLLADNNVRTEDAHPFTERARLQEVCKVPGARPVPWFELKTLQQLLRAHVKRTVADLPSGTPFELVIVSAKARGTFGKLTPANDGTKATAATALDEARVEAGNDVFTALDAALDITSRKDSVAWDTGPEEILYAIVALPWLAEQSDPAVVAAAIGLKARMRGVPLTLVGLGEHPYEMCQALAEATGGTYLNLSK
ncbi:MAG: HEAT repeat domain-containing protein [Planctomycetia bacterium]